MLYLLDVYVYCLLIVHCLFAKTSPPENTEEPTVGQSRTNIPHCVTIKQNVWDNQILHDYMKPVWFLPEYLSPSVCGLWIGPWAWTFWIVNFNLKAEALEF